MMVLLLCGFFLFFTGRSLLAYYVDDKYARDDYRGLVQYIDSRRQTSDAVVLVAPGQSEIFGYYLRRIPNPPPVFPLPSRMPIDKGQVLDTLSNISPAHPRIWLVLWAAEERDPDGLIEQWLSENGRLSEVKTYGTVELELYTLRESR
jgi:hypothetical protein